MSNSTVETFNRSKLDTLAARYRVEDAQSALTVAASGGGDLSRQPTLNFKSFTTNNVKVAVSPDCSYRFLTEALGSAKHSITAYVYNIGARYLLELLKSKH